MASLKGKLISQDDLADVVGDMASFMVFGQGGAAIGKTFNLRRIDKLGRLKFKVTPDGAMVLGEEEMSLAESLIDTYLGEGTEKSEYDKLSKMSKTALEGIWRKMDIGPISDRPKDAEGIVDDIMSSKHGEDWQRKAF